MESRKAVSKFVRVTPRKARLAAALMRGKSVEEAALQLSLSCQKSGPLLRKTLNSAVANAETQLNIPRKDLIVKEVRVDVGPVIKRAKSKSRGGRAPIMKRTSHFTVIVAPVKE